MSEREYPTTCFYKIVDNCGPEIISIARDKKYSTLEEAKADLQIIRKDIISYFLLDPDDKLDTDTETHLAFGTVDTYCYAWIYKVPAFVSKADEILWKIQYLTKIGREGVTEYAVEYQDIDAAADPYSEIRDLVLSLRAELNIFSVQEQEKMASPELIGCLIDVFEDFLDTRRVGIEDGQYVYKFIMDKNLCMWDQRVDILGTSEGMLRKDIAGSLKNWGIDENPSLVNKLIRCFSDWLNTKFDSCEDGEICCVVDLPECPEIEENVNICGQDYDWLANSLRDVLCQTELSEEY